MNGPVVLALDGNSLLHRGYHALAHTGTRSLAGEPVWAVRGLLMQLVDAVERVGPTHVVVGFDDPERSHRREVHPAYKAQRPDKLPTLVSQLALAATTLRRMGVQVEVPATLEADDVLASTAARTREAGGRTVVVTSDRDAFALIDEHTSVLRIINGGVEASPVLTPDRLEILLGVRPEQYADLAALRGDPSDNLPGVRGIGPKTGARLLAHFATAEAVFADVDAGGSAVRELIGPGCLAKLAAAGSREAWATNRSMMAMREDLEIPLEGELPLAADAVRRTYLLCRLPGTQPRALRLLCDVEPPAPRDPSGPAGSSAPSEEDTLAWDPSAEWKARRAYPPLAEPVPDPQLTLF